jgi:hypothetical protein
MRVGITGHQRLAGPAGWLWVQDELDKFLSQMPAPLIGFTSLAMGADQRFAETILRHGGSFTAVLPFADYELKFVEGQDREAYKLLLAQAAEVDVLKASASNRESYFKAGKQVVNRSELLFAVWDGKPAIGLGGTADVVRYAQSCGKPICHIDPVNQIVNEIEYI